MRMRMRIISLSTLLAIVMLPQWARADESESRLSDEPIDMTRVEIPERPRPILELGEPFFDTGEIGSGFTLPTGAVWRPSLIVWGTLRNAVQYTDDGVEDLAEWASRFDLFSNLYLTPTERILVGIRPLDNSGRFTRYTFEAPEALAAEEGEFEDELNADITTLFFEGDLGQLIPALDPHDSHSLDVGVAVGRQPISFQDGMLINDSIDSLGLSRINLKNSWVVNHRVAALWGFNELNRNNLSQDDEEAALYGLFQEIDWRWSTVELDVVYVDSDVSGSGYHGGLGATQRLGSVNTTMRVLSSLADGEELEANRDGSLFFLETSVTPTASDDLLYLNGFWALEHFRSASRDASVGGPLSPTGILFESPGLGRYGAPLDNSADDALGGALGYQLFFNETRTQVILELGGRYATKEIGQRGVGSGLRLQQALGRRSVLRFDLYGRYLDRLSGADIPGRDEFSPGARLEWLLNL